MGIRYPYGLVINNLSVSREAPGREGGGRGEVARRRRIRSCFCTWDLRVWVWGLGFGIWGLGFEVWGLWFEVWGFRV